MAVKIISPDSKINFIFTQIINRGGINNYIIVNNIYLPFNYEKYFKSFVIYIDNLMLKEKKLSYFEGKKSKFIKLINVYEYLKLHKV